MNSFKDLPTFRQVWDGVALRRAVAVAQLLFVIVSAYAGALAIGSAVAWWVEANTPAHASAAAPQEIAMPGDSPEAGSGPSFPVLLSGFAPAPRAARVLLGDFRNG